LCALLCQWLVVTKKALAIGNLHLGDLSRLVISSQDSDSILIADLKGDKESDGLDGVVASVNVISHEEVVGVGGLTTDFEQLAQVVELTVDVTANGDGGAHLLHVGLVDKDFFCLR